MGLSDISAGTSGRETNVRPAPRFLGRFAWAVLAYNLLVIAWGVFVRVSGSGAGCGAHWPLCNGQGIPELTSRATIIEATHRVTSGFGLVLVLALLVLVLLTLPTTARRARLAAIVSMVFMMGEALIGGVIVLMRLVATNASLTRGVSTILHLGNTFLLIGALAITAWTLTSRRETPAPAPPRAVRASIFASLACVLFLGSSGAIAALGDTLFPVATLREGLAQDLSPLAHVFLRLRMFHPFIAFGTGALVLGTAALVRAAVPGTRAASLSRWVALAFVAQFLVGLLNLSLLAPTALQITHLLVADALWIALVLMGWETLYSDKRSSIVMYGPAPVSEVPPSITSDVPVTNPAAGETKNSTAPAISSISA